MVSPRRVLAGGFAAGALDITYAWLFWKLKAGLGAQRIFQSVAAGLLGRATFDGGWPTAALGLGLHFFIATSMALAYHLVASRRALLRQRAWLCGTFYGLLLYVIMNKVVVPLSAAGPGSRDPLWTCLSLAAHAFLVGVPIALSARDQKM